MTRVVIYKLLRNKINLHTNLFDNVPQPMAFHSRTWILKGRLLRLAQLVPG